MKLLTTLTTLTLFLYFSASFILDRIFAQSRSPEQRMTVQKVGITMAANAVFQEKTVAFKSRTIASETPPTRLSMTDYFGNSEVDEQFKLYLSKRGSSPLGPSEFDQYYQQLIQYIENHPQDSMLSLGSALKQIPSDDAGRKRVSLLYTKSVIFYLRNSDFDILSRKKELEIILNQTPGLEERHTLQSIFQPDLNFDSSNPFKY